MAYGTNNKSIQCAPRAVGGGVSVRRKVTEREVIVGVEDDDWTDAQADALFDELATRNREALRGLADL